MMGDTILIHTLGGTRLYSKEEMIECALEQERQGLVPTYRLRDNKANFPAGWLIFSTWEDGCGVVVRHSDGHMSVLTGWQGDFEFCLDQ